MRKSGSLVFYVMCHRKSAQGICHRAPVRVLYSVKHIINMIDRWTNSSSI